MTRRARRLAFLHEVFALVPANGGARDLTVGALLRTVMLPRYREARQAAEQKHPTKPGTFDIAAYSAAVRPEPFWEELRRAIGLWGLACTWVEGMLEETFGAWQMGADQSAPHAFTGPPLATVDLRDQLPPLTFETDPEQWLREAGEKLALLRLAFWVDDRPRRRRKLGGTDPLAMVARYQVAGWSHERLAEAFGVDRSRVSKVLKATAAELGLELRAPSTGGRPEL